MTELEDKLTHIAPHSNLVDNEVSFIEAFEPVTDLEAYRVSILVHVSTEVRS